MLRECGNSVNLLIKRRAMVTHSNGNGVTESNNNPIKVTLTKANKKDGKGAPSAACESPVTANHLLYFGRFRNCAGLSDLHQRDH